MVLFAAGLAALTVWASQLAQPAPAPLSTDLQQQLFGGSTAQAELAALTVQQRAPSRDYRRQQFGDGWADMSGCSVRETILARDLQHKQMNGCRVMRGSLNDPYTGKQLQFQRGPDTSQLVQIDHVVALSDAWQKGAQQLSVEQRRQLANDPLNLLAVDGQANQAKGNLDAAEWLPDNRAFHCQYVARQIAVKKKYRLWVTDHEKAAMSRVLQSCSD